MGRSDCQYRCFCKEAVLSADDSLNAIGACPWYRQRGQGVPTRAKR